MKWIIGLWLLLGPTYWAIADKYQIGLVVAWPVGVVVFGFIGALRFPYQAWSQALAALVGGAFGLVASIVTTQWLGLLVSAVQLFTAVGVIQWCRAHSTRSPLL